MSDEVELQEMAEEAEEAWKEYSKELAEEADDEVEGMYVALTPLSRFGGKVIIEPGMTTDLDPETAAILIKGGKVVPMGDL